MTVQHFTEEPSDGTILADETLDEVVSRDDEASRTGGYPEAERWWTAGFDVGPKTWEELSETGWQRLYRQSDVDAALAAQREAIASRFEAEATTIDTGIPPHVRMTIVDMLTHAAEVVREYREEAR